MSSVKMNEEESWNLEFWVSLMLRFGESDSQVLILVLKFVSKCQRKSHLEELQNDDSS